MELGYGKRNVRDRAGLILGGNIIERGGGGGVPFIHNLT